MKMVALPVLFKNPHPSENLVSLHIMEVCTVAKVRDSLSCDGESETVCSAVKASVFSTVIRSRGNSCAYMG